MQVNNQDLYSVLLSLVDLEALALSGLFVVITFMSHIVTSSYICYKDLTGQWKQYKLYSKTENTIWTYLQFLPSLLADFILILWPTWYFVIIFIGLNNTWKPKDLIIGFVLWYIFEYINELYIFIAHLALHSNILYKYHKRHHCLLKDLVSTSAYNDSYVEFFFMDNLGQVFALLFINLPLPFILINCFSIGFESAVAHSGFHIKNTIWESEYHYEHHRNPLVNFADRAFYDKWFNKCQNWYYLMFKKL